jgi:osmotically-inducible protein OsmY
MNVTGTTLLSAEKQNAIEQAAGDLLRNNRPYAFYFKDVSVEFQNGVLTLRGRVPTFSLRSVLEDSLRNLQGVERVNNEVDVVSSRGLSSAR